MTIKHRAVPFNAAFHEQIVVNSNYISLLKTSLENDLDRYLDFIINLVEKGGPVRSEYGKLLEWLRVVGHYFQNGAITEDCINKIRKAFGDVCSVKTMLGFALLKPHGYAGDYEIIDKVYQNHITNEPNLKNWDLFFYELCATKAVQNRKQYFIQLLKTLESSNDKKHQIHILNLASGPGRDMYEFYRDCHKGRIWIDCVDMDPNAITYAKKLCKDFLDFISFHKKNAFRYTTQKKYDLIWSAGLFDYFDDRRFKFLLKNLLTYLQNDGEMVIGNFSGSNPSKDCMEIMMDWNLNYRSREELIQLAISCGNKFEDIRVGQEPEACNLFLHIKKGNNFISQ